MTRIPRKPVFSALTADDCRAMLGRNHVGHLAFLNGRVVDIEPVHYVVDDGWIFVRSAAGTKLDALAHNPYVAFQVDEIAGTFDWRSTVAHGTVYVVSDDESRVDHELFERALDALRSFVPEALTADDPTPFRRTIYGIHIDALAGRMAEQRKRTSRRVPLRFDTEPARRPRTPDGF